MLKNNRFLICTGGTGGHVIPAINFANYLISKGYKCSIILDERGLKYIKSFKGDTITISSMHLSGNILYKFRALISLFVGLIQSMFYVYKYKPNVCISFGSYAVSMPLLSIVFFKLFKKIELFIHEQNSVIGKTNLLYLSYAKNIFTNFDYVDNLDEKFFRKKIHVGLPEDIYKKDQISKYTKNDNKILIFIYGGSQGSISLIEKFLLMIKKIDSLILKKIKIIIQSPKSMFNQIDITLSDLKIEYIKETYYNNIDEILKISDIAITRAGAGTINDIIKYNIPSIIIPISNSVNNHQFINANYLLDKGSIILMNETKFDLKNNLQLFQELIINAKKRQDIKKKLSLIKLLNTNQLMLDKILNDNG